MNHWKIPMSEEQTKLIRKVKKWFETWSFRFQIQRTKTVAVTVIILSTIKLLMFLDVDTRRRAASDLVRGLCKFHEQRVIEIFSGHVVSMLQVTKIMLWFLKTTEELETERKMSKVCLSHSCSHHSSFFVFLYLSILSTQYSEYTVHVTKLLSNMHTMRVTNHWCL